MLVMPAASQETENVSFEGACESLSGNARSDEKVCVGFAFSDGANELSAGLAATNANDFDGSLWRLSQQVRLAFNTTEILAEEALFEFEADEVVFGELSGNPVVMSDYIEEREASVSGTAQSISYDRRNGTVRLTGQATLRIGENEVMGCEWIYSLTDKTYQTGEAEECNEGIRILLTPTEESDDLERQPDTP